jgi:hypothetical protein
MSPQYPQTRVELLCPTESQRQVLKSIILRQVLKNKLPNVTYATYSCTRKLAQALSILSFTTPSPCARSQHEHTQTARTHTRTRAHTHTHTHTHTRTRTHTKYIDDGTQTYTAIPPSPCPRTHTGTLSRKRAHRHLQICAHTLTAFHSKLRA